MANDKDKNSDGEKCGSHGCSCAMCKSVGLGCNMHWMHWALRLAIILFVFWAGIEFGELKAFVESNVDGGYGYHSQMMRGGYYGGYYNDGQAVQPVVQYRTIPVPDTAPAAASTTPRR